MRQEIKSIFIAVLFLIFLPIFSYCQTIKTYDFMEQYVAATKLSRKQIVEANQYKDFSVEGKVKDVVDWKAFDDRTNQGEHYYKVIIAPLRSGGSASYEVDVFYKDKDKANAFTKGQNIEISGALVKIINDGSVFSVWLYGEELTPKDKFLFGL